MAKNIIIYKAPIYRVFSDNIKLVKNDIIPTIKKEKIDDEQLFYGLYGSYVNMSYNCILADEYEAKDYISFVINRNKGSLIKYYEETTFNSSKKKEFKEFIESISSCVYFDPLEVVKSHTLTKSDFKSLKRKLRDEKK